MTKEIQDYFWNLVHFPLKMGGYTATEKTLNKYYHASLKYVGDGFCLRKFKMQNEEFESPTTFQDGMHYVESTNRYRMLWTLPWFSYKIPIGSSTSYTSKSVASVVDNSIILIHLQGYRVLDLLLTEDNSPLSLWGYESSCLVKATRCILATCCFFYGKHRKITKDNIPIDRFLWLCAMNLLDTLLYSNNISEVQDLFNNRVIQCNGLNFRRRYGMSIYNPVTVTMGRELSKGERHSISITKYGKEIQDEIKHLHYTDGYSVRQIQEILNNKGISISKSSVGRIVKSCTEKEISLCPPYDLVI